MDEMFQSDSGKVAKSRKRNHDDEGRKSGGKKMKVKMPGTGGSPSVSAKHKISALLDRHAPVHKPPVSANDQSRLLAPEFE